MSAAGSAWINLSTTIGKLFQGDEASQPWLKPILTVVEHNDANLVGELLRGLVW